MQFFKNLFKSNKSKSETITESFASGQYASIVTVNEQQATEEMIKGMEHFGDMVNRVQDKLPHLRRGHLFEAIIAAKENAENASRGSSERTLITHLEGRNTAAADLERFSDGRLIGEAQAKFSVQSPNKIANMIVDAKYEGMDRYIPADKVEAVRNELQKRIQESNDPQKIAELQDAMKHLKSHDTNTLEVWQADRNPTEYAAKMEWQYAKQEIVASAGQAAVGAAVVGGGISMVKNVISAYNGQIDAGQAARNIAKDTAGAAVRGGTVGSAGAVIRYGAQKAGIEVLTKSNVAMAVAASMVEVGGVVYDFAKGKISAETAVVKVGQTGTSTVSGLYSGAAAGAVFGPAGAVVGSMVGYMLASSTYQSCVAVLERAKLAEEEAARVIALSEAACQAMREQRAEFERYMAERVNCKKTEFQQIFRGVDSAITKKDFQQAVEGMANLAGMFGKKLKLQSFAEFDDFMRNSREPLRL